MGSIERFLSVYLDYMKGRLPFVLAPVQYAVIAIKTGDKDVDAKIEEISLGLHKRLLGEGYRSGLLFTTKTSLSGEVRRIESTIKPAVMVYIGAKEVKEGFITLRPYMHDKRKRVTLQVAIEGDPLASLIQATKSLEEDVARLAGTPPRLPGDVSHLL